MWSDLSFDKPKLLYARVMGYPVVKRSAISVRSICVPIGPGPANNAAEGCVGYISSAARHKQVLLVLCFASVLFHQVYECNAYDEVGDVIILLLYQLKHIYIHVGLCVLKDQKMSEDNQN